jgi:predicted TIM-barrel fold metal-dependent hydrolase
MIAEAGAIVSGGHMAPDKIAILLEAARKAGITRLLVSHPEYVIEATEQEVGRFADLGANIEHCLCMYDEDSEFYHWDVGVLKRWIDLVGPERTSLGSDLGQVGNSLPIDAFRKALDRLHDLGVREADLRRMVRDNPARLLGLDEHA